MTAATQTISLPSLSAAARTFHSVAHTAMADRFRSWSGASGRRYTVSVFPFDAASADCGLPDFDGCVVIPVRDADAGRAASPAGRNAVRIEGPRDARALRAAGVASGVREWHVHLLADTAAARAAVVGDLERLGCAA